MITFTRQADGTFVRTGEFQKGTLTVRIFRDGARGLVAWSPQEAIDVVENAISISKAPAQEYELVEESVETVEVMDARSANLKKARDARAAKKAEQEKKEEDFIQCPLCSGTTKTGHEKGCMNRGIALVDSKSQEDSDGTDSDNLR